MPSPLRPPRHPRRAARTGALLFLLLSALSGQPLAHAADGDERVLFLHHSTGAAVYSQGDVEGWIRDYNTDNGTQYRIETRAYPNSPYPWDNYPYDYWNLWVNGSCDDDQPGISCLDGLVQDYDVIVFKHCYPGADVLEDTGSPDIASPRKSLENYQRQYRALRDLMDGYADTQFIVWTLAPRHRLATTTSNATLARQFVDWVRHEWLTEDGNAHPNIAVFDFWGYAAEENSGTSTGQGPVNTLRYDFEKSHSDADSHPNVSANQAIGPRFAEFIVTTIEGGIPSVDGSDGVPGDGSDDREEETDGGGQDPGAGGGGDGEADTTAGSNSLGGGCFLGTLQPWAPAGA